MPTLTVIAGTASSSGRARGSRRDLGATLRASPTEQRAGSRELVPAEPGDDVGLAHPPPQDIGDVRRSPGPDRVASGR